MARRPWTEHPRVMPWRRRSVAVDRAMRVAEGFRRHRSGRNAALVAHYGFLSVFPLVLALTTVLGFVLQDRPDLQADIIDSALANLPIVGQTLESDPASLRGSTVALVLGLATALWAGMKAFIALHGALDDVREVDLDDRAGFAAARLRALGGIAVVGGAQVVSAFITSLVGVTDVVVIGDVLLVLGAVAVNTAVLGLTYRWLCSECAEWRGVLPGAIVGGVAFSLLQVLGTTVVARAIANASPVYGTFASVIGLLTWLSLHATVTLVGAELNRVLAGRTDRGVAAPATDAI